MRDSEDKQGQPEQNRNNHQQAPQGKTQHWV
jgi:hypothetical protein